jgi:TonB family protein
VDANAPDSTGRTPIIAAAETGDSTIVAVLLGHGVDTGHAELTDRGAWTAVAAAAVHGHDVVLRQLARYGVSLEWGDAGQWTPLMHAAERGHVDAVMALLTYGAKADVEIRGQTAEKLASAHGYVAIEQELHRRNSPFARLDPPKVPGDRVYPVDEVEERPQTTQRPTANVPGVLLYGGREGHATVTYIVTVNGTVESVGVVRASHPAFGAAAVESVAGMRFTPGRIKGRAVPVRIHQMFGYAVGR